MQIAATFPEPIAETLAHTIGNQELGVFRPVVEPLGEANLFFTERLAMRGAGVLLGGRAVGDVTVHDDEGRDDPGSS